MSEMSMEERSAVLARVVADQTRQGWRVLSQGPTQAQLIRGRPTNHLLHLILALFTLGLWIVVWVALVVFAGEKQRFVSVDERGAVQIS